MYFPSLSVYQVLGFYQSLRGGGTRSEMLCCGCYRNIFLRKSLLSIIKIDTARRTRVQWSTTTISAFRSIAINATKRLARPSMQASEGASKCVEGRTRHRAKAGRVDASLFHFPIHSDPSLWLVVEISFVEFVDPVD